VIDSIELLDPRRCVMSNRSGFLGSFRRTLALLLAAAGLLAAFLAAAGLLAAFLAAAGSPGGAAKESSPFKKEDLDLPYNAAGASTDDEEAPEITVFYGFPFEADAFFYCLDSSLSMADGEWAVLQREVIRSINEFSAAVQFGLVFFHEEVDVFPANGQPATATEREKAAARRMVQELRPKSWTCALKGLEEVFRMANRCGLRRRSIIFLSDGKPTCRGTDFVTYRREILEAAAALNPQRIPLHTIGIGDDVDEDFLQALAKAHGGTYRRLAR
jgi:hypothetical protein